jgi:hypothetical protein
MSDFVEKMDLVVSKFKGIQAIMSCSDNDVKLALIEIREMGRDEGRKQGAVEELKRMLEEHKLCNLGTFVEQYIEQRLNELEGAKK